MSEFHRTINQRRWRVLRRVVLDAANWRCATCKRYANEVDHVTPLQEGGAAYDLDNLQALCRGCHIRKTASENGLRRANPEKRAWAVLLCESVSTC